MRRAAIGLANAGLLVLCGLLAARLVSEIAASAPPGGPEPGPVSAPQAAGGPASWESREVILERNLFRVSTLLPPTPEPTPPEDESYAATKLKLVLLGTVAAGDAANSWAAVEDQEAREQVVVRVGDTVQGKARVERIDRRRIVLRNQGHLEELALEEDPDSGPSRPVARRAPRRNPRLAESQENLKRRRKELQEQRRQRREKRQAAAETAADSPASLFSQARILPRYENGEIVGVRVNAIKAGSVFQDIGLSNGDTITEVNGVPISGPEQSVEALRQFAEGQTLELKVLAEDGSERSLRYEP